MDGDRRFGWQEDIRQRQGGVAGERAVEIRADSKALQLVLRGIGEKEIHIRPALEKNGAVEPILEESRQ